MVGHDQAPDRCSYGSSQPGPQMKPWHLCRSSVMAMVRVRPSPQVIMWPLGRSRGMTGSDMTKSPSDLVALAYQAVLHWFGHDQAPK